MLEMTDKEYSELVNFAMDRRISVEKAYEIIKERQARVERVREV